MTALPEVEGWSAGMRLRILLYGVAAVAVVCAGLALAADSDGDETQAPGFSPSAQPPTVPSDAGASRAATGTFTIFEQWDTDSREHIGLAKDARKPAAGGWGWW